MLVTCRVLHDNARCVTGLVKGCEYCNVLTPHLLWSLILVTEFTESFTSDFFASDTFVCTPPPPLIPATCLCLAQVNSWFCWRFFFLFSFFFFQPSPLLGKLFFPHSNILGNNWFSFDYWLNRLWAFALSHFYSRSMCLCDFYVPSKRAREMQPSILVT